MKSRNRVLKVAVAIVGLVAVLAGASWVRSEFMLRTLTHSENARRGPRLTAQERKDRQQRNRRFDNLWLAHRQRDVSAELLPFVQDPSERLRLCQQP
jgi:hypothetical protein